MIVYDLQCRNGHTFEEWFSSGAESAEQMEAGAVACPECGDSHVAKALSAPRINSGAAAPQPAGPCGLPACAPGGCAMMGGE